MLTGAAVLGTGFMKSYFCALFFMGGLFLSGFPTLFPANIAEARTIAVVFDDSGSMIGGNNGNPPYDFRYAYASYSLQTLRSLLSDNDKLIVSFMSGSAFHSTGNVRDDIEELEQRSFPNADSTPYEAVVEAIRLLEKENSTSERWLFIITDGSFTTGEPVDLQAHINDFQRRVPGGKVVCLGIAAGGENRIFNEWKKHGGATVLSSDPSPEIAGKMQQIAAMVTSNTSGKGFKPAFSGQEARFTPPFPLKRFTILQQGSTAKDLVAVESVTIGTEPASVGSRRETATPEVDPSWGRVRQLCGAVVPVSAAKAGTLIPAGSPVTIKFAGSIPEGTSVVLLPEVSVNLVVNLYDQDGNELDRDGGKLYSACLEAPIVIRANLEFGGRKAVGNAAGMKDVRVFFHYDNAAVPLAWNEKEGAYIGSTVVVEGLKPIRTSARYEGYIDIQDAGQLQSTEKCAPRSIAVKAYSGGSEVRTWEADVRDLGDDLSPLEIVPFVDGRNFRPEEIGSFRCTVETSAGLRLSVEPMPSGQGWLISPRQRWCTPCLTPTGAFPVQITFDGQGSQVPDTDRRVTIAITSDWSRPTDTVAPPAPLELRISDPGWLRRCRSLLLWLVVALLAAVWGLGIIKKRRFYKGSEIEYERAGISARRCSEPLHTSWLNRWLVPYVPESKTIEGITFKAGTGRRHVFVSRTSLSENMKIAGITVEPPFRRDQSLSDNETVEIVGRMTERYTYHV